MAAKANTKTQAEQEAGKEADAKVAASVTTKVTIAPEPVVVPTPSLPSTTIAEQEMGRRALEKHKR